jgi:ribosome maturation factor RimP
MAKGAAPKVQKLEPAQIEQVQRAVFEWLAPKVAEITITPEANPSNAFVLIDAALEKEAGYWFLRIYIDKPTFDISLDDCANLSRALDKDIEAFVETIPVPGMSDFQYNLEVSSPGLFRNLNRPHEYQHYAGRGVVISEIDSAQEIKGTLSRFDATRNAVLLKEHPEPISLTAPPRTVSLTAVLKFGDVNDEAAGPEESGPSIIPLNKP